MLYTPEKQTKHRLVTEQPLYKHVSIYQDLNGKTIGQTSHNTILIAIPKLGNLQTVPNCYISCQMSFTFKKKQSSKQTHV